MHLETPFATLGHMLSSTLKIEGSTCFAFQIQIWHGLFFSGVLGRNEQSNLQGKQFLRPLVLMAAHLRDSTDSSATTAAVQLATPFGDTLRLFPLSQINWYSTTSVAIILSFRAKHFQKVWVNFCFPKTSSVQIIWSASFCTRCKCVSFDLLLHPDPFCALAHIYIFM